MKIVLNRNWGGFSLPKQFCEMYGYSKYDEINRTDSKLVAFVEENPDEVDDLEVIEIPDDNTDYMIDEFDGFESIIYVIDGKLYRD